MVGSSERRHSLTAVLSAEPAGLDPAQLQGAQNWAESLAVSAIFDQLFYLDPQGGLVPGLGASMTSADAGVTWELALHGGIRFSDGEPFDSEAVRFNWERIKAADRAPARAVAAKIKCMEVVDPLRLRIFLAESSPQWNLQVARALATIGSPRALSKDPAGFAAAPVGAGPFLLAEWSTGERMRFVRNPYYWQADRPMLDEIEVLTGINEAAAKFEAMASGRAQVALEPMGGNIARFRAQPERFTLMTTPENGGGVGLAMNLSAAPFDDVRVRRALALTLASAEFVDRAGYEDRSVVMTTIDRPHTPYAAPDIRLPETNIPQAQALIDAAVAETGAPIRFAIETFPNEGHLKEAHVIKAMLEERLDHVEVDVAVDTVAELMGKWQSGSFQASNYAVQWAVPALDLPGQFSSTSPTNIMRYRSEAVDAALARLAAAAGEAERIEAHRAVLRNVLDDNPVIWLSRKQAYHVVDRLVEGWQLFYSLRPRLADVRLHEEAATSIAGKGESS